MTQRANTQQLVLEQSRKRKRSLDLKSKSISSLEYEDFPVDSANKEAIDLCGNYITTLNPNVFARFSNLTILNLMSNELTSIPLLESLPNLTELYLSKNKITQISNLQAYTKLIVLDLRANQITSLANLETAVSIVRLSLSSNKLTHISDFPVLPQLRILYLFGNLIEDREDCLRGLKRNSEIETLILKANPVDPMGGANDDPDFLPFHQALLQTLPKLKWLDWEPVGSTK